MVIAVVQSKNLAIHTLRGLSAFLVLVHHELSSFTGYWNFSRNYIDLGRVGVVSFFLISGYVIRGSIINRSISSFLYLRFFRLFPIYWLSLLAYLVVCNFASERAKANASITSDSAFNVNAIDLVLNLTMFQELLGLKSMLPPAWTLSIELLFYCTVCILVAIKLANWERIMFYASLTLFGAISILEYVTARQLPTSVPLLLGMAFLGSVFHDQSKSNNSKKVFSWESKLALVSIIVFYSFSSSDSLWNPVNRILSTILGLGVFLAFFSRNWNQVTPVFVWLGDISYSLYIISPCVMVLCDTFIPNLIYKITASIICTLLLSTLTYRYLEKPLQKWSKIRSTLVHQKREQ
jgi:peptidoglycan/LPS O-acetylase OafA/YrhL